MRGVENRKNERAGGERIAWKRKRNFALQSKERQRKWTHRSYGFRYCAGKMKPFWSIIIIADKKGQKG